MELILRKSRHRNVHYGSNRPTLPHMVKLTTGTARVCLPLQELVWSAGSRLQPRRKHASLDYPFCEDNTRTNTNLEENQIKNTPSHTILGQPPGVAMYPPPFSLSALSSSILGPGGAVSLGTFKRRGRWAVERQHGEAWRGKASRHQPICTAWGPCHEDDPPMCKAPSRSVKARSIEGRQLKMA